MSFYQIIAFCILFKWLGKLESGVAFGDAHKLVVFGNAFRAGERAGLDLAGAETDGKMSNRGIFAFARAVGQNGSVTVGFGSDDSLDSFGEGTNLIWFN